MIVTATDVDRVAETAIAGVVETETATDDEVETADREDQEIDKMITEGANNSNKFWSWIGYLSSDKN